MWTVPLASPVNAVRFQSCLPVFASKQWTFQECWPLGLLPCRSVMYSPLRGSGGSSSLTAAVTKTLPPQTTGDDQPAPGTSAAQRTFFFGPHSLGSVLPAPTPDLAPPRKAGQLSSARREGHKARARSRLRGRMGGSGRGDGVLIAGKGRLGERVSDTPLVYVSRSGAQTVA